MYSPVNNVIRGRGQGQASCPELKFNPNLDALYFSTFGPASERSEQSVKEGGLTKTHRCADIPGALIAQRSWGNRQNGIAGSNRL